MQLYFSTAEITFAFVAAVAAVAALSAVIAASKVSRGEAVVKVVLYPPTTQLERGNVTEADYHPV